MLPKTKNPTCAQYEFAWKIADTLNIKMPQYFTSGCFSIWIDENKQAFNEKLKTLKQNKNDEVFKYNLEQWEKELNSL